MSRKRVASFELLNNGIPTPNYQLYQYEYIRPGCYYFPQVTPQVTPYNCTYLDHWQPYCTAATYVVDGFGRANYPSDFEYQLQVGTPMQPQTREIIYNYYDDGETEISSLPQIEEEDIRDDLDVSFSKKKRLNNDPVLKKSYSGELAAGSNNNVYRSKEGYLVEEPAESD